MEVVIDLFLLVSIEETNTIHVFLCELSMLLRLAFCSEIMLALEDLYGDLWLSSRANQNMEVFWVMLSLDVSRCAGDIDKTNVNTTKTSFWHMGKRNVFEAVASGGAGDLLLTMNLVRRKSDVCMCSMV